MYHTNDELTYAMEIDVKKKRMFGKKVETRKKYSRSQNNLLNQTKRHLLYKITNKPVYNSKTIPFNL